MSKKHFIALAEYISEVVDAMDAWADDIEEAGYPNRAEHLRWQAQRGRTLLARTAKMVK